MIDKKGERNSENVFEFICMFRHLENVFKIYACLDIRRIILSLYACLLTIDIIYACLFLQLISSIYVFVYTNGEKYSSLMHVYVEHSLHIFMFIAMHELRGSFYEA